MQKRRIGWLCGVTMVLGAGFLSTLAAGLKHEPSFYRKNQEPPSDARKKLAYEFASNFGQMIANKEAKQENWSCTASEAQLNCFFDEILFQRGEAEDLRKLGISGPSVSLEEDQVRLAFRYGTGWFSSVLSYDFKMWLVPKEPNVIAVEITRARAGALPISKQSILHYVADIARKQNYKVTMYRHEGNAVALIDLQGDQQQPKSLLTALNIGAGTLSIQGRTLDHALPALDPTKAPKGAKLP